MRQSLQLRLGQQLTMTPQLQQAIRLLQLSSLDLQTEIQQVLDSNLMLERADESQEYAPTTDSPSAEDNGDANAEPEREAASSDTDSAAAEEIPVDSTWDDNEDFYDGSTSFSRDDDDNRDPFEHRTAGAESLRDYLLWQMRLTPFSDSDTAIALAIIDAVDDAGYLSLSLEDIHQGFNDDIELSEVEAVLHRIQRFDPPGVAARNPAECLLLQLEQLPRTTPFIGKAQDLVKNHLELLAGRDFNPLMRRLKVAKEELQEIIALIQTLNPHPGTQISSAEPQYVAPDVFVYRHKNGWRVELNPESTPKLRINRQYSQLVRRADNSNDNLYLKNHLQEARWFLKSLRNRNETLLKVAICIVERQRDFFEHGEEHMRPLVLRDIAETMGMHESTISRVTTQKYMHTPRGIYEFKYFFSSHVGTNDGGECSSIAIRAMIKKLIAAENPRKPLSDHKIAESLSSEGGIKVARRTVAKYREVMSIPSSTDRKRLT
ncbi:MAG: RNA polymerase factor sigma-54 [Candidatus Competibacteraceae bacterium]|jgi:RNA polymerase sigma-54 factor|nr:RNA polymerase factor sigma-54 [Candidatus Competibacteraceae bacterium]